MTDRRVYRALLLDVYGTLVHDDDEPVRRVAAHVAALAGADAGTVAREWSARLRVMADDAYGPGFRSLADLTVASLAATAAHFGVRLDARRACREQMRFWRRAPLYADGRAFLDTVRVPVCLVSDADRADLAAVLARHGIVVDAAVTSEDARAYKPRREPFELALDRLGLDPGDVLHVGDSPSSDVAGAGALGIDTVFVGRAGRRLPAGVTATYTVDSLTAIAAAGRSRAVVSFRPASRSRRPSPPGAPSPR